MHYKRFPKPLKTIANFAVTYRCNGRCKTCGIWKISEPDKGVMSLNEIQEIFSANSILLKGLESIQLTGGEPFLREDLVDIIEVIHDLSPTCFVWLPTNGLTPSLVKGTISQIFDRMKDISVGVSVSLDGIEEVHDEQRGLAGSYKRALKTLSNLSAIRYDFQSLRLSIGMTLTPFNSHQISDVYKVSKLMGAGFSVRPVNFSNIYYRNRSYNENKEYTLNLATVFRDIVKENVRESGYIKTAALIYYLQGALDYIRKPNSRSLHCHAASESIFIDPYGDVYPCIMMDFKLGNLRRQGLDDILISDRAYKARELIDKLNCPKCWVECEVYREIYKDKIGLAKKLVKALIGRDMALN